MPPASLQPQDPPGLLGSLRAGVNAGGLTGVLFGLLDGAIALGTGRVEGLFASLGCLGASTLIYGAFWIAALLTASVLLHPFLRSRSTVGRYRLLLPLGLGFSLFAEIYWWSRPFVFSGYRATSPERLGAGVAMLVLGLLLGWIAARLLARLQRRLPKLLVATGALAWAGGLLFFLAQAGGSDPRGLLNARNAELPNVLLIVVDALRADVLGCYGNERVKTPHIDRLAERGIVFEHALVQAPYTWTSFGSFLTGKYPRRHGLVKMAPGVRMSPNVTLPWHLKGAALEQGGKLEADDTLGATFMTGTLSHGSGLMRGFDVYFEALVGHELVDLAKPWSAFRSELLLYRIKNKLTQRFDSSLVVNTAKEWFRANGDRRFVAMVHLYSTHTPYDPPEEFRSLYVDPDYEGPVRAFRAKERKALESGAYEATPADVRQIQNLYYAGTTQADHDIGVVLSELERQGVLDDTIVILTSDHGEELGDHGLWEHNFMYQTNLIIPLVIAWPAGLPQGERIGALVESVDLVPTLCDWMGVESPGRLPSGRSEMELDEEARRELVDGVSLAPLVRGEVEAVKPYGFAENGTHLGIQSLEWKLVVPRHTLRSGSFEALAELEDEPWLFHLTHDPDERENLFAARPAKARELWEELVAWNATMPIAVSEIVRSHRDEESASLFESLGYTEGGIGYGLDEEGDEGP